MYWCAACGNPRVIIEKEREGDSLTKGLIGSAVLGPVGALAGADGKEITLFYCPKCGARLHRSMPQNVVISILRLLNEAKTSAFAKSALKPITLSGFPREVRIQLRILSHCARTVT